MTWSKKQNTRAYDPIQAATLTSYAGTVASQVVNEAYFTVINDYSCQWSITTAFNLNTTTSTLFSLLAPLALFGPTECFVGSGHIFDAAASVYRPVMVQREGSNNSFVIISPTAISVGTGHSLKIGGHFSIR